MRHEQEFDADVRSSALWGKGGRGERRSSALWGKSGRGVATATIAAIGLGLPLAAGAHGTSGRAANGDAYIAPAVLQAAANDPNGSVHVIIQSTSGAEGGKNALKGFGNLKQEFRLTGMVAAEVPSAKLDQLAKSSGLTVTLDALVRKAEYTSNELWVHQNGASRLWPSAGQTVPNGATIAVIDSGIEKDLPSFGNGSRVVARQVFASLPQGGSRDGRGHGSFVAGIAAGEAPGYAGVSPTSNLVDLDVMDDSGRARTSDVIRACEWVLENKDSKGIRVVNMSLHSSSVLSIRYHPLNRAVEKLWFSGVVVVAAAGNYGVAGGPSGVKHAPGNDPFVITVGAVDLADSARPVRHDVPYWSAWGYTNEGFAKPDMIAAGRYMVGPVPSGATLRTDKPENVVSEGYMRLSGTSFAAPVVSGVVAQILARHPEYTPDRVKGVLMTTARRIPDAPRAEQGAGEVNAVRAANYWRMPPNPNAGLNRFVLADPAGGSLPAWDASAWYDAMRTDSAWDSSAWLDSAWLDSAWLDSSWSDSAWLDSAWLDSAWNDSAWADSTAYEDNANGDGAGVPQVLDATDEADIAADPDLALPNG